MKTGFIISVVMLLPILLLGDRFPWLVLVPMILAIALTLPVELARAVAQPSSFVVQKDAQSRPYSHVFSNASPVGVEGDESIHSEPMKYQIEFSTDFGAGSFNPRTSNAGRTIVA